MKWIYADGGRKSSGFRGESGDCVTRAIAIATGENYSDIYQALVESAATEKLCRGRGRSHPRTGVKRTTYQEYLSRLGWRWTPTMGIGTGCRVHLRDGELPMGELIVKVSGHLCAVINGVIYDTHDPSRGGTRCVYGYFRRAMR